MSQTPFYATSSDLHDLLAAVEAGRELKYTLTGHFDSPRPRSYPGHEHIPDLGVAAESQVLSVHLLVSDRDLAISVREIHLRIGGTRFGVDQQVNPATVELTPGGNFGPDCIIAGRVATASDDPRSLSLMAAFRKEIRKRFEHIRAYWVGPEAVALFDRGCRLTFDVRSPRPYDLKRPDVE